MQKGISIYTLSMAAFFSVAVFSSYFYSNEKEEEQPTTENSTPSEHNLPQIIKSADLNKSFNFAGEVLPMDNFDVRERLDRELLRNAYYHSNTILNLKKLQRFFPMIERMLAEHGLPDDLKYLAVAESDLRNASSPAGAKGLWQFMKGTGKEMGLEVNSEVDERYNYEKATKAACKFLKKYRERFGSWTLAAAAYNMGASRLKKEMAAQKEDSYFDLNLNQETSKYVFRIVALKEIMSNPEAFGFYIDPADKYPPLDNCIHVEVNKPVSSWADFAKQNGMSYRMLKVYNPWMISTKLTNKYGKQYLVKVPKK